MGSEEPFPRERLEKELQLAEQKLKNLTHKRTTIEQGIQANISEINSLEQSLTEKKRRLTQTQQALQTIRSKIDQVRKIKRLLRTELEKSEEERQELFQQHLDAETRRREDGGYTELETRVFQEILKESRTRTRKQFSEKEESAFLRSQLPTAIHDRIEKLGDYEKVDSPSLLSIIDELASQYDLLRDLPREKEEDANYLRLLNKAGLGYLILLKILERQEGPSWEFRNFVNDLESVVERISASYYQREGFIEITSCDELLYSIDSHVTAVCKLINDKNSNKISSTIGPLQISIEERLGSILKKQDSNKKIFLNDLFKEAVLKNKLFSAGSVEGIADLSKTSLQFSQRDIFGRNTALPIKEIQKKLNVISLVIAEIFLEDENVCRTIESRLS